MYELGHHGDAEVEAGLVDLAVNVRQAPLPPWLADALTASLSDLARYPIATPARAAVAARHGRTSSSVLLTAGAAQAFVLIAQAYRQARRPVVIHPQFTEPEAALLAAGHEVTRVVLPPPFVLDPSLVPDDADLVFIGNPTNPTSVLHPAAAVSSLARPGRLLVVDEAFADTTIGLAPAPGTRAPAPGAAPDPEALAATITPRTAADRAAAGVTHGPTPGPEPAAPSPVAQGGIPGPESVLATAAAHGTTTGPESATPTPVTHRATTGPESAAASTVAHRGTTGPESVAATAVAPRRSGSAPDGVPEPESLARRTDVPGLVVLRSLTKTWALAGLRIGYALGPADVIDRLTAVQPLWPVSTPALAAAIACAGPTAVAAEHEIAVSLAADRAYLVSALSAVPGLRLGAPPSSSFVLVERPEAEKLRLRLREHGYAVRRGDTFPGLGPRWLRIAVRDRATTDAFVTALTELTSP